MAKNNAMQKQNLTLEQLQIVCCSDIIESITSFNSIIIVNDSTSQVERLVWFLKTLTEYEVSQLLAVSDHKGGINFLWKNIPPRFRNINDIEIPDGDNWSVYHNFYLNYYNQIMNEKEKESSYN